MAMATAIRRLLFFVAAISPTVAGAQTIPVVTGPIPAVGVPGTDLTRNYPQQAAEPTYDLSARGYVEEEFFFQGTATQFQTPALADGIVLSTGHPYKTRMIVRRPRDPNKFNGVVLVEWANVTPGYNFDIHWRMSRDYLTREGYAFVGVSAQRVGVQVAPFGLTEWSPTRYGSLDVTDNGAITDDSLSYDIFSQAGRAIRTDPSVLSGLRPQLMIAVGASQSASRLTPYYNSIHPLHHVYDGFLLHVGGGPFRTDIPTKLFRINTEREIVGGQATLRQPDSNTFHGWEIAGASHLDYWFYMFHEGMLIRDGLAPPNFACDKQPLSHVNNKYVLNAGYAELVDWIVHGRPPATAQPIVVTSTSPTIIPRDANGLAFGGIRLAMVDVPVATNDGANTGAGVFCILYGSHTPFPPEKVRQLYADHNGYVSQVRQVTDRNVHDGFVLQEDAKEIVQQADDSTIGTQWPNPIP